MQLLESLRQSSIILPCLPVSQEHELYFIIIFIMTLYIIPTGELVMYHVNECHTPESKVPLTQVIIIDGWAPAVQLTKT